MDIVDIIRLDNKDLVDRIGLLRNSPLSDTADIARFRADLDAILEVKHRILWDGFKSRPDTKSRVSAILEDERQVRSLAREFEFRQPEDHDWADFLSALSNVLNDYVRREDLFLDDLPQYLARDQRGHMVTEYERLREDLEDVSRFQSPDSPSDRI